ncbi:MAG: NAD(P)/FAD-dependent oxidoreductase [Bdellovibrionales bacterium]|nr:NAD(P)/FAD-dependent oxidoreductase [Bdellovibrionales bacterium]
MVRDIDLRIEPDVVDDQQIHRRRAATHLGVDQSRIQGLVLMRRSLDARHRRPRFVLTFRAFVDEPVASVDMFRPLWRSAIGAPAVVIIGAGPAGLFAALRLLELGARPIIVERGKDVRRRRRDVAEVSRGNAVDPDSNYCFGEGGAGTFSDGKLYTRSTKRGDVRRILDLLMYHGASAEIGIDAHPHIGTNKLPSVIAAMTATIREFGGEVLFDERVVAIDVSFGSVTGVRTQKGLHIPATAVIVATGHSADDMFEVVRQAGAAIEQKPFAVGVRVEHPQAYIDQCRYGTSSRHSRLPPASYAVKTQADGRGVYSFCMCPGGIICPAATGPEQVVVNGWSPSKRNNPFANSGIVVEVGEGDVKHLGGPEAYRGLRFQRALERRAWVAGGGGLVAPAQRVADLSEGRLSPSLPACSYHPGLASVALSEVFPAELFRRLQLALRQFEKDMPGFVTNDAVAVASESRTSSPVRIPRDPQTCGARGVTGLFPCGEGAGYAGGIMSAAMDGERVAEAVRNYLFN